MVRRKRLKPVGSVNLVCMPGQAQYSTQGVQVRLVVAYAGAYLRKEYSEGINSYVAINRAVWCKYHSRIRSLDVGRMPKARIPFTR